MSEQLQKLIKLTEADMTTYGGFRYEVGQEYRFRGIGPLCSTGYSHAYLTQPLAELLNPIHAAFKEPRIWDAEGIVTKSEGQLKVGCQCIRLIKELPSLALTTEQQIAFGIMSV